MADEQEKCEAIECLEPSEEVKQEIMNRAMERCDIYKDSRGDYGMCLSHETGGMFYHWRKDMMIKKDETLKKL